MVGTRVRRLWVVFGATLALLAPTAVTANAQAAIPAVTVTLDSPTAGATLSGPAVRVTYTVTTAPGEVLSGTWATLVGTQEKPYVPSGSCESGCTYSVTFDTTAVPSSPTAADAGDYTDGPQTLTFYASTMDGQDVSADVGVLLDNNRPSEKLGAPQPDPQTTSIWKYTATDRLHLEAYPSVNDGGSAATMTYHYVQSGAQKTAPLTAPVSAGAPWTLDLDTSGWNSGSAPGWVTTTDDRGVSSIGTMVYVVVDHGFTLTGPTMPGTVEDFTLDNVPLSYTVNPSTIRTNTFPAMVTTYLDGNQVEQHALPVTYPPDSPGTITAHSGGRIPAGDHDLRFVVRDNRGVSEEVDYHLTVTSTLQVAWTNGAGRSVLPGPLTLTGTADATDTQVAGWTFYIDDRVLDSWTCITTDCPTHVDATGSGQPAPEVYTPGKHQIRLEVATRKGLPETVTGTLTVLPFAHTDVARHRPVTFGHAFTLTGHAVVTGGKPAPAAQVTLQRRRSSGGRWSKVATGAADESGQVQFRVRAARSAQYRMLTATDPDRWAGRSGAIRTVASRAELLINRRPIRGRLNRYAAIRGTVAPASPRLPVYVQEFRGRHWWNVDRNRPDADGLFTILYRVVRDHTLVRLYRPAGGGLTGTHSRAWRITGR